MLKKLLSFSLAIAAVTAFAAVDVNKASQADLDSIKGIGPSTSKQILAERKSREYKDWQDLMARVKGIGEAKASRLSSEGLTVNGRLYKDMTPPAVGSTKHADPANAKPAKPGGRPDGQDKHPKQ
jgi:competence protein ComEA